MYGNEVYILGVIWRIGAGESIWIMLAPEGCTQALIIN